jgi:hypothetical protein
MVGQQVIGVFVRVVVRGQNREQLSVKQTMELAQLLMTHTVMRAQSLW